MLQEADTLPASGDELAKFIESLGSSASPSVAPTPTELETSVATTPRSSSSHGSSVDPTAVPCYS